MNNLEQEIITLVANDFRFDIRPGADSLVLVTIEKNQYKVYYSLSHLVSPEGLAYALREMRIKWNQDNELQPEKLP
jgi:hypothetical protein